VVLCAAEKEPSNSKVSCRAGWCAANALNDKGFCFLLSSQKEKERKYLSTHFLSKKRKK